MNSSIQKGDYSFRRNLRLMGMVFYRPHAVVDIFIGDLSPLYSLVPLVIFTVVFEISYIVDYILKTPGLIHFFAKIFNIPDVTYNFYQIFLLPPVHIVDFFLYDVVIFMVVRLMRIPKLDAVKATIFFIFIWDTIGLVGFFTESIPIWGGMQFLLNFTQPIFLVIYILYSMEYIHSISRINRLKSLIPSTLALVAFLAFRIVFLG